MILGERLKRAIEESGFSNETIALKIGMSSTNLYRLYKKDSFEIKYLIEIADLLKLPLSHFFDEKAYHSVSQTGSGNAGRDIKKQKNISGAITNGNVGDHTNTAELQAKLQVCEAEKAGLQQQLLLKDQLLEAKNEIIDQLKK